MTIAELVRAIESAKRKHKAQAQERAAMDYILADLIGHSVARIHSSSNHLPQLYEAYPTLFSADDVEDKRQVKKDELSALRFKQFANAFNKKYKGVNKAE